GRAPYCCGDERCDRRGVEMKKTLAIAAVASICAVGHPIATTVGMPLAQRAPGFAVVLAAAEDTGTVWNGTWQGTTVSGVPLVLQLQAEGQRLTGRLTVGKQSAKIVEGKIVRNAFAITTGPI